MISQLDKFIQSCHERLLKDRSDETKVAIDYLKHRHVKKSSVVEHKIGYCGYRDKIPADVAYYGKDPDNLKDKERGYYYFIRGKIIVPVYSEFGQLVGLATRRPVTEPGNTWWNLPKPFKKSHHLFLLNKSRKVIFDSKKIYLVEGYMDAIILFQEGLKNVNAIMGTMLSTRKIGLISRYCNNVCFCLDVDKNEAGQKATDKAIAALKDFGFCNSISVIENMPIGKDPDEYVMENGLNKFLSLERKLTVNEIEEIYQKVKKERER
jgi:DNA primase catalytic core